ncbi:1-phosphofructokinase [Sporolactobacillus shoreae]|uniref:Tagatose-6-phosphate kinase n=1 Tax=Sporolactobacillus shoreae TaxID=1465501 RepID=A0A4Z0GUW5_9BACL|nr:1-phosphofructokinase [Sporolactobacillus shoreae]TGB00122.1 1-phosphofructokinase [Sporolactobacillus shoreae]
MITTVTLNPALDKLLETDAITLGETNRVRLLSASAAGKGIDVAKVLRDLDCQVTATGFLGGDVAGIFIRCFKDEKIENRFITIHGSTRTNIQLFEQNGSRTELLERGPSVTDDECLSLMKQFRILAEESDSVTICGSVPDGVSEDYFRHLIRTARHSCRYVIVDTSGKWLHIGVGENPDLIKPNRREMTELMGKDQATDEEIIAFAQQKVKDGLPYILVSLGGEGAMLICQDGVWRGKAPEIPVKSTVGCGDTMVASLSVSLHDRLSPEEMLRRSIALSAANAMTFETAHVIINDYLELLPKIHIEKIR